MPTYERVAGAGEVAAQNVYKIRFAANPCSDMPQLQAWDDHLMTTVASESLAGTVGNGNKSLVAAAHVSNGAPPIPTWVPAAMDPAGGLHLVGGVTVRANRLRGASGYLLLGDSADLPPVANGERRVQLAFGCAGDSTPGTSGHQPVLAVKTFYAGAPPVPEFYYNAGVEGAPNWVLMTSQVKGVAMAMGVKNTIHATGVSAPGQPATATTLAPVIKPGSGEKWAEQQWLLTVL
jgi:hypothetical protein